MYAVSEHINMHAFHFLKLNYTFWYVNPPQQMDILDTTSLSSIFRIVCYERECTLQAECLFSFISLNSHPFQVLKIIQLNEW